LNVRALYAGLVQFEEKRKAAQEIVKLGLDKIVVPATVALEVPGDKNNDTKIFIATEEYNTPNDRFDSYDIHEKIYVKTAKNPALKEHMLQMFLQLVRLIPKIDGLLAQPAYLFLEKDVKMPRMVINGLFPRAVYDPIPDDFKEILAIHAHNTHGKGGKYLFESTWKKSYTDRGIRKIFEHYTR